MGVGVLIYCSSTLASELQAPCVIFHSFWAAMQSPIGPVQFPDPFHEAIGPSRQNCKGVQLLYTWEVLLHGNDRISLLLRHVRRHGICMDVHTSWLLVRERVLGLLDTADELCR